MLYQIITKALYLKRFNLGFRKIKAKKYSGIFEYFKESDHDKKTIAYYILYRDYRLWTLIYYLQLNYIIL